MFPNLTVQWHGHRDDKKRTLLLVSVPTEHAVQTADAIRALAEVQNEAPTFNHTRGDGVYDPCPICLAKMPREDLLALIKDLRSEVWELQSCLDDRLKCTGTLVHSEFESCPRCDR